MTGLEAVVAMRRRRVKPGAVFVDLERAARPRGPSWWDDDELNPSLLHVAITPSDALADIDFRALTGLVVYVLDNTSSLRRYRKVAAMIAEVEPAHLVMPVWEGDTLVVHQRWAATDTAPARTATYRVGPS